MIKNRTLTDQIRPLFQIVSFQAWLCGLLETKVLHFSHVRYVRIKYKIRNSFLFVLLLWWRPFMLLFLFITALFFLLFVMITVWAAVAGMTSTLLFLLFPLFLLLSLTTAGGWTVPTRWTMFSARQHVVKLTTDNIRLSWFFTAVKVIHNSEDILAGVVGLFSTSCALICACLCFSCALNQYNI